MATDYIVLRVQGAAAAQAVFDLFHSYGVAMREKAGGWNDIVVSRWGGTDYSALVHARKCFPGDRIYCKTAKSDR